MSYPRVLKVIPLIVLLLALWAALAGGQAAKKTHTEAPSKVTRGATSEGQSEPGAALYSTAAERKALREMQKRAQERVRKLAQGLSSLPDESDRRVLQQRIANIKRDARLEQLRTKAYFALGRGDLQTTQEINRIIERILEPRFSVPVTPVEKGDRLPRTGGQP